MNARDRKLLKENRMMLIKNLEVDTILDILETQDVLSNAMVNCMRTKNNSKEQNTEFLNLLPKRGPKAFEKFKSALEVSQQFKLLDILSQTSGKRSSMDQFNNNKISSGILKRPGDTCDTSSVYEVNSQNIHLIKRANLGTVPLVYEPTNKLLFNPQPEDVYELGWKDVMDGPSEDDLLIHSCSPEFMMFKERDSYMMKSRPRGLALLICIHQFEENCGFEDRKGGMVDVLRLEHVLTQLQFVCHRLINGNIHDIWETLVKFGSMKAHSKYDCMLIAVMSHGSEGVFYARDGNPVNIEQMMSIYNNINCPGLQNKPKIFLIQACRGKTPDMGTDEIDGGNSNSSSVYSNTLCSQSDGPQPPHDLGRRLNGSFPCPRNKLPINSDYFVGYGTVSGYAAMRNTAKGSWFIQAFVRALARHAHDRHFLEIMTDVNRMVMKREGQNPRGEHHRCKAMSESRNTLSKLLYFFPGL